jgi:hypothetical protein
VKPPTGFNPVDIPGQVVDEGWSGRITDPETGAGLFNSNTSPSVMGIDPITGEEAPLGSDVGFGASVRRWLQAGIYNSDFSLPANSFQQPIDDEYNPLPYWTWVQSEAGAVRASIVNDDTLASGRKLRFSMTAFGSTSDDGYVTQLLPVPGSEGEGFSFDVSATFRSTGSTHAEAPLARVYLDVQYLDAGRGIVASPIRVSEHWGNLTGDFLTRSLSFGSTNDVRIPEGAYYALVKVGVDRSTEPTTSAGTVDLTDTWAIYTPFERHVVDTLVPQNPTGTVGTALDPYATGYIATLNSSNVKFPATQVPSSDPNTLDDYEEGPWTPSYGGGFTSFAYSIASGRYHKVGRMVTVWFNIVGTTAIGDGTAFVVSGLPFLASSEMFWSGSVSHFGGFTLSSSSLTCGVPAGQNYVVISRVAGSGTGDMTESAAIADTVLYGSVAYLASA